MKKSINILLLIFILFAFATIDAFAADILIPNGDFEGSDISLWIPVGSTPTRVTTEAHTGSACLKAGARSVWYFSPQIHVNLEKDTTYTLTAWVKNSGTEKRTYNIVMGVPKSANAEDDLITGNADYIQTIADSKGVPTPVLVNPDEWVELKVDFRAPKTSMCNFFVQMSDQDTTEDFYVDDISIVIKDSSASPSATSTEASSSAESESVVVSLGEEASSSDEASSAESSSENIANNSSEVSLDITDITEKKSGNTFSATGIIITVAAIAGIIILILLKRKKAVK